MNISLLCVCDEQYSYRENIHFFFSFFLSCSNASSTFLSAILVSLIETRKSSIELYYSKKKNLIMIVQPSCMMWKRGKEKEKSRSPFFCHSRQMEMLSSGHRSFSFSLPTIMCLFSLSFAHSLARFFRAQQLSKMETFISTLSSFSYIYRHIDILREMADILCALFDFLCNTSTRWYQLLSAGNDNKAFFILIFNSTSFVIESLFLI